MLILDAFNVLHAVRTAVPHWRLRGRGMGLLDLAAAVAEAPPMPGVTGSGTGQDAALVCDGTGGGAIREAPGPLSGKSGVTVRFVFAGPGRDADAVIKSLLDEQLRLGRARGCLVVTSDKQVQNAARGVLARTMASDEYLRQLARWYPDGPPRADGHGPGGPGASRADGSAGGPGRASGAGVDRAKLMRDLQTWAAELPLDDLDMAQWLKDGTTPKGRAREEGSGEGTPGTR